MEPERLFEYYLRTARKAFEAFSTSCARPYTYASWIAQTRALTVTPHTAPRTICRCVSSWSSDCSSCEPAYARRHAANAITITMRRALQRAPGNAMGARQPRFRLPGREEVESGVQGSTKSRTQDMISAPMCRHRSKTRRLRQQLPALNMPDTCCNRRMLV